MNRHTEAPPEPQVELENQFILRLPAEPAKALRETLKSGAMNLKDRLSIRLEPDMRYGEVRLDHWLLHAKLMDLPSIMESLKTIDNKSFYKTADICQILICTEEEEPIQPEDDPPKQRKKDPNKVDKKYLWPHGIAPPLKNVRRRRFRKTLKKKFVEAPEIEKEVKRLLRVDNDAVAVKWEVISEEALAGTSGAGEGTSVGGVDDAGEGTSRGNEKSKVHRTIGGAEQLPENADSSLLDVSNQHSADVAEHEIFGEAVSDSDADVDTNSEDDDEDDGGRRIDVLTLEDEDESSRLMMSAGDESRMSADNSSPSVLNRSNSSTLVTQFSREMFLSSKAGDSLSSSPIDHSQPVSRYQPGTSSMDREAIRDRLAVLEQELADLRTKKEQREQQEIAGDIENVALRQRFSLMLDEMITNKELEIEQLYDQMG